MARNAKKKKKTKITKQNENKKQSQSLGVLEQAYVTQARRKLKGLIIAFFSQRPTVKFKWKNYIKIIGDKSLCYFHLVCLLVGLQKL